MKSHKTLLLSKQSDTEIQSNYHCHSAYSITFGKLLFFDIMSGRPSFSDIMFDKPSFFDITSDKPHKRKVENEKLKF